MKKLGGKPRKNLLKNFKNIPSQTKRRRGSPRKEIYEDELPEIMKKIWKRILKMILKEISNRILNRILKKMLKTILRKILNRSLQKTIHKTWKKNLKIFISKKIGNLTEDLK